MNSSNAPSVSVAMNSEKPRSKFEWLPVPSLLSSLASRVKSYPVFREEELINLGDARLNKRFVHILAQFAQAPIASIPQAMGGAWKSIKAAYRFFTNKKVSADEISKAHRESTLERIGELPLILSVQDTTYLNFTTHRTTRGLGPIGKGTLRGFLLHSALAVSSEGVPLGLLAHKILVRPEKVPKAQKTKKPMGRPKKTDSASQSASPEEPKESARWIEVSQEVEKVVLQGTRVIHIGDRENDFFEFFSAAQKEGFEVLVRGSHDRVLSKDQGTLRTTVSQSPLLGAVAVEIPRSKDRKARKALVEIRACPVTLPVPAPLRKSSPDSPTINVLLISEISTPPDKEKPISWLLLTSLPVTSLEDAHQCLVWYTYRWRIERYHYAIKSGCTVEQLELEEASRLFRALAVYQIVAFRLLHLTYLAREEEKSLPCTLVLTPQEWMTLYALSKKTHKMPKNPPSIKVAIRQIATLGGFIGRKGDGDPGMKVLWRGFMALHYALCGVLAVRAFPPDPD